MNSKKINIFIIITLPFILFFPYFYKGFPIELAGCDLLRVWGYNGTPIFDFYESIKNSFTLPFWSSSFSRPHFNLTSELPEFFTTILYFITHNTTWIFKLNIALNMIMAGLGSYALSYYLSKQRSVAFLSGIIYMLCPYILSQLAVVLGKAWAFSLMPWGYLFLHKVLFSTYNLKNIFICTIIMALTLLGHPENFFLGGIFYALFVFLLLIFYSKELIPKKIPTLLMLVALVFLLTSFTYIPSLIYPFPYTHVEGGQIETWLRLNTHPSHDVYAHSAPFFPSFFLLNWEWLVTPFMEGNTLPLSAISWGIVFILATISLIKYSSHKMILIFGLMSVFGFWFNSGFRLSPFSIYQWLYSLIPHFRMTRHPDRYLFHTALAFSIMAPLSLNIINTSHKYLKKILLISISILLIGSSYYYSKTLYTFYPSQKPNYIGQITHWLKQHNQDNFRVINAMGCPTLSTISFKTHAMADQLLINYYDKDYFSGILSLFGFKYIVIGKNDCDSSTGFNTFQFYPDLATTSTEEETWTKSFSNMSNRKIIFDTLNRNKDFIAHSIENSDVVIFENKKALRNYALYPSQPLLVFGGHQAYDFLSHPDISQDIVSPIFITQDKNQESIQKLINISHTLILHNSTLKDLSLMLNKKILPWINIYPFKSNEWDIGFKTSSIFQINPQLPTLDHSWLLNSLGGNILFSKFSIINKKQNTKITVPISITKSHQKIFLRLKYIKPTLLKASLNTENITLPNNTETGGFQWIELPFSLLQIGNHTLTLTVEESKSVYLDTLITITPNQWETFLHQTIAQFKDLKWIQFLQNSEFTLKTHRKTTSFILPRAGQYEVQLFSRKFPPMLISSQLNNKTCRLFPKTKTLLACSIYLEPGQQKLILPDIDFEWISIEEKKEGIQKSNDVLLTHTETYFPGWQLKTSQQSINPIITHLFMNGFIITKDITSYKAVYRNKIHLIFASISLITFISMIGFLCCPNIKK